jgi:hypothetical protein
MVNGSMALYVVDYVTHPSHYLYIWLEEGIEKLPERRLGLGIAHRKNYKSRHQGISVSRNYLIYRHL